MSAHERCRVLSEGRSGRSAREIEMESVCAVVSRVLLWYPLSVGTRSSEIRSIERSGVDEINMSDVAIKIISPISTTDPCRITDGVGVKAGIASEATHKH